MSVFFQKSSGRCFGTYPLKGQDFFDAFKGAFEVGYRFFDTAQMYNNEEDLGDAIKKLGIARSEIFITTKVHPNHYTRDQFLNSIEKSLQKLNTNYRANITNTLYTTTNCLQTGKYFKTIKYFVPR